MADVPIGTPRPCPGLEVGDELGQRSIRHVVGVVGAEDAFVAQVAPCREQALADVRLRPVFTNVIRQSWMSVLSSSTLRPPSDSTKSLDSASL